MSGQLTETVSSVSVKKGSSWARMQEEPLWQSTWAISRGWRIKLSKQSAHHRLMLDQPSLDMAGIPRIPWGYEPPEKPWTLNPFSLCTGCFDQPCQTLLKPLKIFVKLCWTSCNYPVSSPVPSLFGAWCTAKWHEGSWQQSAQRLHQKAWAAKGRLHVSLASPRWSCHCGYWSQVNQLQQNG